MISAATARRAWIGPEPLHTMIYFVPEAPAAYAAAGLGDGGAAYFAARSAPLGRVPAETVVSTFYNFSPSLVRAAIPSAWEHTTPEALIAARYEAAGEALRRGLSDTSGVAETVKLARKAAEAAVERPEGRPLFSGYAALAWPDDPLLELFHAQSLLREFRGDGHIAALVLEGLSGLEALLLHAASGEISQRFLRLTRGWQDGEWDAAAERLTAAGLVVPGERLTLTDAGRALRRRIEERTDAASLPAYGALTEAEAERLAELGTAIGEQVYAGGLLSRPRPPR